MKYAALIRGINVGGNHMVPMPELVKMFVAAKCTDIKTYVNSGNIVFAAPAAAAAKVPAAITAAVATRFGFAPEVVVRDGKQLADIVAHVPFPTTVGKAVHVAFLGGPPARGKLAELEAARTAGEQLSLRGKDLYMYLPNGAGKSRLSNTVVEKKLGTIATMRNWNTVEKLAELTQG